MFAMFIAGLHPSDGCLGDTGIGAANPENGRVLAGCEAGQEG